MAETSRYKRQHAGSSVTATLPLQRWQARLLCVHPGSGVFEGDLLIADMTFLEGAVLHDTQQHVDYYALSYTWGQEPDAQIMFINGISTPIRQNLYDFLMQFRASLQSPQYIWIDAICINQSDPTEKAFQVASMLTFYEKATQVIAWLGPAGLYTRLAIELIESRSISSLKYLAANELEGVLDILDRAWPRRIWVKQEVWAAKDLIVKCGKYQTSYDNLTWAVRNDTMTSCRPWKTLRQQTKIRLHIAGGPQADWRVDEASNTGNTPERANILTLLYETKESQCTDLRDRIFALVGMSSDPTLEINYLLSPSEVFVSLARHLIYQENLVGIVLGLEAWSGSRDELGLPSWCPDWRFIEDPRPASFCHFYPNARGFVAVGPLSETNAAIFSALRYPPYSIPVCNSKYDLDPFIMSEPNVLILQGFRLGKLVLGKPASFLHLVTWNILSSDNDGASEGFDRYVEWQQQARKRVQQIAGGGYLTERGTHAAREGNWVTQLCLSDLLDGPTTELEKSQRLRAVPDLFGKRSFEVESGPTARNEDVVIACLGCDSLLLLRQVPGDTTYTFVGPAKCNQRVAMEDAATMLRYRQSIGAIESFKVV